MVIFITAVRSCIEHDFVVSVVNLNSLGASDFGIFNIVGGAIPIQRYRHHLW